MTSNGKIVIKSAKKAENEADKEIQKPADNNAN